MVLAACGPAIADDVNDDDVGSSSSTSDPSASSNGSSSGDPTSSDVSTGAPLMCEQFNDEGREGTPVTVVIANDGNDPVILDNSCFNTDYLDMETPSGWYWPSGFCSSTCEAQFIDGCFVCDGCAVAAYTVVMPGGTIEVTWPGVLFETVTPPAECFAQGSCAPDCPRRRIELAEIVMATANAISYDACVIANDEDPSVCSCDDTKALSCETNGFEYSPPNRTATAIYEPGMAGPITITFGP
jgi:hypothetical protein